MAGGSVTSGLNPQTAQGGIQQAGLASPMSGFPGPQQPGGGPLLPGNQFPPPFAQGPPNAASYATASYPTLFGGQWNQLAQQLAGPQYSPGQAGTSTPLRRTPPTGPGWGGPGWEGGFRNTQPIFNRGGGGFK